MALIKSYEISKNVVLIFNIEAGTISRSPDEDVLQFFIQALTTTAHNLSNKGPFHAQSFLMSFEFLKYLCFISMCKLLFFFKEQATTIESRIFVSHISTISSIN